MNWPIVALGEVLRPDIDAVPVQADVTYRFAGVYSFGRGLFERGLLNGSETTYKVFHRLHTDQFVMSQVKGWEGALARVTPEFDGFFLSPVYPTFGVDPVRLDPGYLAFFFRQSMTWTMLERMSKGIGARRNSVYPDMLLSIKIPLPPLAEQRRIVAKIERLAGKIEDARRLRERAESMQTQLHLRQTSWMFERIRCAGEQVPISSTFMFRNELIRPNDGSTGRIRFVGLQHIESHTGRKLGEDYMQAEELPGRKFRFYPGDIVYGYLRPYLNKVWIADTDGYCSVDQYVLSPLPDIIDTEYLARYLRSESFLVQAVNLTHNLMLPRLRSGLMGSISIPLTSLDEQRRLVADLDRMQTKIGIVQALQGDSAAELDALLPAILDRAFKGEL